MPTPRTPRPARRRATPKPRPGENSQGHERQARLDAQKKTTLVDDDGDPLHEWAPPDPDTLPEITVAGGERPAIADAALAQ